MLYYYKNKPFDSLGLCNFSVGYTDVVAPLCNNNYKIVRKWEVIDWCTSQTLQHNQIITVKDKEEFKKLNIPVSKLFEALKKHFVVGNKYESKEAVLVVHKLMKECGIREVTNTKCKRLFCFLCGQSPSNILQNMARATSFSSTVPVTTCNGRCRN